MMCEPEAKAHTFAPAGPGVRGRGRALRGIVSSARTEPYTGYAIPTKMTPYSVTNPVQKNGAKGELKASASPTPTPAPALAQADTDAGTDEPAHDPATVSYQDLSNLKHSTCTLHPQFLKLHNAAP